MDLRTFKEKTYNILHLAEKYVKYYFPDKDDQREEFEKIFNCLIQKKDIVSPYKRRNIGISDDEWIKAFEEFKQVLNEKD